MARPSPGGIIAQTNVVVEDRQENRATTYPRSRLQAVIDGGYGNLLLEFSARSREDGLRQRSWSLRVDNGCAHGQYEAWSVELRITQSQSRGA